LDSKEPGDTVEIAGGSFAGSFAFAEFSRPVDFAIVELPDAARDTVHPSMQGYGGPTGLAEASEIGDRVLVFGNSPVREGTPADDFDAREGYVVDSRNASTRYHLYNPTIAGDSGSPALLADGQALGVHSTTGVDAPIEEGDDYPCVGCSTASHVAAGLERARQAVLVAELKTWPLQVEPSLPATPAPGTRVE